MKVILLDELKGRGGEGDVIDVATGYAVNFLFPKKIAIAATKGNLKQLEQRKHNIAKREANRLDSADKLVAALDGQTIRIGAKVGEEGQLFGSVTPIQVADAINAKFNTEIDRRRIDLHGVIKTVGDHTATISIYRELKVSLTIEVVDEKTLLAQAKADAKDESAEAESVAAEDVEVESTEAEESPEILTTVETVLEDVAATIAEAAEAAENDDADADAIAEAAVEVLQDVEGVIDAAVADAVVVEVEAELEAEGDIEAEGDAEAEAEAQDEAENQS